MHYAGYFVVVGEAGGGGVLRTARLRGRTGRLDLLLTTRQAAHQTLVRFLRRLPKTRSRFNGRTVSPTLLLGLLALFTVLHAVTTRGTIRLIQKCFRRKFPDLFGYVCSLNMCFQFINFDYSVA